MSAAAYIAKQPIERRKLLAGIHATILRYDKTVTAAVAPMMGKEMINYQAPGIYKYGLSGVKNYMSLHVMPIYGSLVLYEKYKALLPRAKFQKGCINFTNEKEMPIAVVKELIRDCSAIDLLAIKKDYEKSKKISKK
jgi:Domain of unknown function (DU1801)